MISKLVLSVVGALLTAGARAGTEVNVTRSLPLSSFAVETPYNPTAGNSDDNNMVSTSASPGLKVRIGYITNINEENPSPYQSALRFKLNLTDLPVQRSRITKASLSFSETPVPASEDFFALLYYTNDLSNIFEEHFNISGRPKVALIDAVPLPNDSTVTNFHFDVISVLEAASTDESWEGDLLFIFTSNGTKILVNNFWLSTDMIYDRNVVSLDISLVVTESPTASPTESPTASPSESPTLFPTGAPTSSPTKNPTGGPTKSPTTGQPSKTPTKAPTSYPVYVETESPTAASDAGKFGTVEIAATASAGALVFLVALSVLIVKLRHRRSKKSEVANIA